MNKPTITVLIPGGHITPAVATIEVMQMKEITVHFVARQTSDSFGSQTKEVQIMEDLGVPVSFLVAPKWHRHLFWQNLFQIRLFFSSLLTSWSIFSLVKPDVLLSFGGYVSFPLALIAKVRGIPIVIHEQTKVLGAANRKVSRFATKTCLSWEETTYAPKEAVITGNPIRSSFFTSGAKPSWIPSNANPLIFVTGGNQGSLAINNTVIRLVPEVIEKYTFVHQTGDARDSHDYKKATKMRSQLNDTNRQKYFPKTWLSSDEMSWLLHNADLVIGRAGANTVTELMVSQTKALLIPLPTAAYDEQRRNAQELVAIGQAMVLDQSAVDSLGSSIETILHNKNTDFKDNSHQIELHRNAAHKLTEIVLQCVRPQPHS